MSSHIGEFLDTSYTGLIELFQYKPYLGDPDDLFASIINTIQYLDDDEKAILYQAYEFTLLAHQGQKRLSGEEYIVHPIKAMEILLDLRPDITTLAACLLHDLIEDTPVTYDDIVKKFGTEVADICEGVSKVSNVRYLYNDGQLETLTKTFLAMSKDLRVIFVKLADRIHNIQTLDFHPREDKKKRIAMETMKVYVPIAKKLGLYTFAVVLENGAFRILEPGVYEEIVEHCSRTYEDAPQKIEQGKEEISKILEKNTIPFFSIKGRLKSPYRIYEKLYKKYKTFDVNKVTDVLAFRVITDNISHCYTILGHIHSEWRPLIHKIKDYISIPKFNNYQSIHTTVLGMFPYPVEIQIRTQNMEDIAEHGIAAHFLYTQGKASVQLNEKQSKWIKDLQTAVSDYSNTDGHIADDKLRESLSIEFFNKSVFVYTPKGDIMEMPLGSTVLDFAFRIHSDVGLSFRNAIVNSVIKPINYVLKTGDVVSINTFSNKKTATPYRIEFLQSPTAKNKLQKYLREENYDNILHEGKIILEKKLIERDLPSIEATTSRIVRDFSEKELNELYISVFNKQRTPGDIIRAIYKDLLLKRKGSSRSPLFDNTPAANPIIDQDHKLDHRLCSECKPGPGQKIIAMSGKKGLIIHTLKCPGVYTGNTEKFLEAHRDNELPHHYNLTLTLTIPENTQTLIGLMGHLAQLGRDMNHLTITKHDETKSYIIQSTLTLENPSKAYTIITELRSINKEYIIKTKRE